MRKGSYGYVKSEPILGDKSIPGTWLGLRLIEFKEDLPLTAAGTSSLPPHRLLTLTRS